MNLDTLLGVACVAIVVSPAYAACGGQSKIDRSGVVRTTPRALKNGSRPSRSLRTDAGLLKHDRSEAATCKPANRNCQRDGLCSGNDASFTRMIASRLLVSSLLQGTSPPRPKSDTHCDENRLKSPSTALESALGNGPAHRLESAVCHRR